MRHQQQPQQQQQHLSTPIHHNEIFSYVSNNLSQDSLHLDDYNYYYPQVANEDIASQVSLNDYFTIPEPTQSLANDDPAMFFAFNSYGNPGSFTTLPEESRAKSQASYRVRSKESFDANDIHMVGQDAFDIYGRSQNELITINDAKDWQDLNFVKADDVMYEFSDEEEDDDDWESNRLDDSMDLDETESHSSLRDEDHIADDYIDEEDIYSPSNEKYTSPASEVDDTRKLPQAINPAALEKEHHVTVSEMEDFKPQFQVNEIKYDLLPPTPRVVLPSQNLMEDDSMREEFEISEPEGIEAEEEEEEENEEPEPLAQEETMYEKVLHDRSFSTDSVTSVQQKPRAKKMKKEAPKPKEIKEAKDSKEEEHVCLINNPKTGKPCHKRFSRPYDLVRHQNSIHASKRSFYRCLFCEDDLRRKNNMDPVNDIVIDSNYRNSELSAENSQTQVTSTTVIKRLKNGPDAGQQYMSNKTFSRCDALTRHLRFRHGLGNTHVNAALDFAKNNVEFCEN